MNPSGPMLSSLLLAVPLFGLAGSAIAYVVQLFQGAAERRRKRFFELMTHIDGPGTIAAKVAAIYALREFKEHREFVIRFCRTQQANVTGPATAIIIDEMQHTLAAVDPGGGHIAPNR